MPSGPSLGLLWLLTLTNYGKVALQTVHYPHLIVAAPQFEFGMSLASLG